MRTALVTGANRGIGEAIAVGLGQTGLNVLVGARDLGAGQRVADRISNGGGQAEAIEIDVSTADGISHATGGLAARGKIVDVLVNNAAVLDGKRLLDMDDDMIRHSVAVNALGPLRLMQALAPGMAERGYGRIVNVSSDWGNLRSLGPGAYGITKAFLNAITIKVASELPSTVKVNAMNPGWVRTQMGGDSATRSTEEGADTALWLATLPDDGPTGGFFHDRKAASW
jgi:NAD(P)-dependent dehydrogenase (short-subunit alcohol dehydrogenase family)